MIHLLILLIFAVTCSATNHDNVKHGENQSRSRPELIARWIELDKLMNDDHIPQKSITLSDLRLILKEKSEIEKTASFRSISIQSDKSLYDRLSKHRDLVNTARNSRVLINSDATVTNVLLKTFDLDANDCTTEYLVQLNEIYAKLENRLISSALDENRLYQYENCWRRLIGIVNSGSMLLSHNAGTILNTLGSLVYPYWLGLIEQPKADSESVKNFLEVARISHLISKFLSRLKEHENFKDYLAAFEHFVEFPCEILIDTSIHVMSHVYGLLKLMGENKRFITIDDAILVNRYAMCDKVMLDVDEIRSYLEKLAYPMDESGQSSPIEIVQIPDEPHEIVNEPNQQGVELITQQLPVKNSDKRHARKIDQMSELGSSAAQSSRQNLKPDVTVSRILKTNSRGYNVRYPTIWSDGMVTSESKAYLVSHWKDAWDKFCRLRHSEWQFKYASRKAGYPCENELSNTIDTGDTSKLNEKAFVIRIEQGKGRGIESLHPTHWSDGRRTTETREYLKANWQEPWDDLIRRVKELNRRKYESRLKRTKEQQLYQTQLEASSNDQSGRSND